MNHQYHRCPALEKDPSRLARRLPARLRHRMSPWLDVSAGTPVPPRLRAQQLKKPSRKTDDDSSALQERQRENLSRSQHCSSCPTGW